MPERYLGRQTGLKTNNAAENFQAPSYARVDPKMFAKVPKKGTFHKFSRIFHGGANRGRKIKKTIVASLAIFIGLNIFFALLMHGRTPLRANINGNNYGFTSVNTATAKLESSFAGTKLKVTIDGTERSFDAAEAGIKISGERTFKQKRTGLLVLPLFAFIHDLFVSVKPAYDINQATLENAVSPFITEVKVDEQNASASIPADLSQPVTVVPEVVGREMSARVVAEEVIEQISQNNSFAVEAKVKTLNPKWVSTDVTKLLPDIEKARKKELVVHTKDKSLTVKQSDLTPMLGLNYGVKQLKVTINKDKLAQYLSDNGQTFYIASLATKTVEQDGVETSRTNGSDGQQLDTKATAEKAASEFEKGNAKVEAVITVLKAETKVAKTYTNTSSELYDLIDNFAKNHDGSYYVAAVELNGPQHRSAFYHADEQVITASTFKVFIAYGILQKIEDGSLSFSGSTKRGTVRYCMEQMILNSDNDCASALQTVLGWPQFDKKIQADGFTSTVLNNYDGSTDKHTTARDEMSLITKLYNGELLGKTQLDYLFNLMEKQNYRDGIPAGSHSSTVADKPGWLYALNHDIGVVYSPKATYALVILTDNAGGWTNVRLLANQIYGFYNK